MASSSGKHDVFTKSGLSKQIIGLPPTIADEEQMTLNSFAVVQLFPAIANGGVSAGTNGLKLYGLDIDGGVSKYNKLLSGSGAEPLSAGAKSIYVAFLNDTSISESFSVDYGESKLEAISNASSSTIQELTRITGKKTLGEAIKVLSDSASKSGGIVGTIGGASLGLASGVAKAVEGIVGSQNKDYASLMAGGQIDFPMIWQGASFSPSYSFTVRLYNPEPGNNTYHKKYIVNPLAKLLAFITPESDVNQATFNTPLMCRADCPGLFKINAGYISSIDVIKGGEANDIGYTQRVGMIDVKMTINNLYNSFIAGGGTTDENRPTMKDYINNLTSTVGINSISHDKNNENLASLLNNNDVMVSSSNSPNLNSLTPSKRVALSQQNKWNGITTATG